MRKRKRPRTPSPLHKGFMVERFPLSYLSLHLEAATHDLGPGLVYGNVYTASTFIKPPSGSWTRWSTTFEHKPDVIDQTHGLMWFTCDVGRIEAIGFEIHHNIRKGAGARAEAYLRLAPRGFRRKGSRGVKTDYYPGRKMKKIKHTRQARQQVGRSYRRF